MADRPRFYADAHIASAVIRALREKGVDILAANEVGLREAPDEEHLAFALREGRVLVSRDKDFLGLHADGVTMPVSCASVERRALAPSSRQSYSSTTFSPSRK